MACKQCIYHDTVKHLSKKAPKVNTRIYTWYKIAICPWIHNVSLRFWPPRVHVNQHGNGNEFDLPFDYPSVWIEKILVWGEEQPENDLLHST
jgi:hypothetical protein